MNKPDQNTGLYLVGTLIMFGILIVVGTQVVLPSFQKGRRTVININVAKPEFTINKEKTYTAKLVTSEGNITAALCITCAPKNVNNFVYLSNRQYYAGTKFHRVVKDLLIQGGDRNTLGTDTSSYGKGKASYFIEDEVNWDRLNLAQEKRDYLTSNGYKNNTEVTSLPITKYSLAMANDGANTNSTQFFIVTADSLDSRLQDFNGVFTVIGEIKSGFEVIEKINNTPVNNGTYIPSTDITLQKIEITTN